MLPSEPVPAPRAAVSLHPGMMDLLIALLLLWQVLPAAAAEHSFPPSLVVLPLTAFSNASIRAQYSCNPSYATEPCSGHGDCLLLLDAALPSSAAFLNASSVPPIPASSMSRSSLDPGDFESFDLLPAAVCACHAHWTGKGDYINHLAMDGDSCAINREAVLAVSGAVLLLFVPLLLLSIDRLYRWAVSLNASLLMLSPQTVHPPSSQSQALTSDQRTVSASATEPPQHKQRRLVWKGRHQLLHVLRVRCMDITFIHPFCSLLLSLFLLVFLALRITTDWTIGTSWLMAALMYAQHIPSHIALCAYATTRLRLASALAGTRSNIASFRRALVWTKRIFVAVCIYAAGVWSLVLQAHGKQGGQQQLYAMLALFFCNTTDLGTAAMAVLASTRLITRALSLHLNRLSVEQRNERLALAAKVHKHAQTIAVILVVNMAVLIVISFPRYRQAGIPYYVLLRLLVTVSQVAARFRLLLPPKRLTATVAPSNLPTAGRVEARKVSVAASAHKQLNAATSDASAAGHMSTSPSDGAANPPAPVLLSSAAGGGEATVAMVPSAESGTVRNGSQPAVAADSKVEGSMRLSLAPLLRPLTIEPID